MSSRIFGHSVRSTAIMVFVLLIVQSCTDAPSKTVDAMLPKEAGLHLIDSLLSLCRATFDSARKDHNRKDILVRGQQLIQQTEKLAEAAQYKLDTLAKVVELEARATLEFGDSVIGRKRMVYVQDIYRRTGNKKELAKAYLTKKLFFAAEKDSTEMIAILDSAAQIALAAQDTLNYIYAVNRKARLYLDLNRDDKYLQILLNLLEFQRSNFRVNISQTAFVIGGHYARAQTDTTAFTKAFKYYLEAIENLHNDSSHAYHHSEYYVQVGYMYYDMANYKEARKSFDKALELSSKPDDEYADNASMAISWIESCYRVEKKYKEGIEHMKQLISKYPPSDDKGKVLLAQNMLELYMLNRQPAEADRYANELLGYDKQGRIPQEYRQFSYELIGELNMLMDNLDEARVYLLKAYEIAKQDNDLQSLAADSRLLVTVDSTAGRYLDAIGWFNQFETYIAARRSRIHLSELRELDIKYATEKRIDSLKTLTERTGLQHSLIEQTSFVRNLFVTIAILLVLILAILFGRYRLKQRVNKQLEEKQQKISQQNLALGQLIAEERKLLLEKTNLLTEKTQLLVEKEWLLKEIHHRVKNNFHIVASLLEIQSSYLKNNEALSAIKESQHRIHSMSIVHQKLYQSDTLSTIHMPEYIYELVEYLRESYGIRESVGFSMEIENIELNHASAITLGLILNEAITNAIKYAFATTKNGKISISLTHISDSQILLSIVDNGRGLPTDFDSKIGASMGMELLQGLTDDLGGRFSIETNDGTHIKVIFNYKPVKAGDVSFSQ